MQGAEPRPEPDQIQAFASEQKTLQWNSDDQLQAPHDLPVGERPLCPSGGRWAGQSQRVGDWAISPAKHSQSFFPGPSSPPCQPLGWSLGFTCGVTRS